MLPLMTPSAPPRRTVGTDDPFRALSVGATRPATMHAHRQPQPRPMSSVGAHGVSIGRENRGGTLFGKPGDEGASAGAHAADFVTDTVQKLKADSQRVNTVLNAVGDAPVREELRPEGWRSLSPAADPRKLRHFMKNILVNDLDHHRTCVVDELRDNLASVQRTLQETDVAEVSKRFVVELDGAREREADLRRHCEELLRLNAQLRQSELFTHIDFAVSQMLRVERHLDEKIAEMCVLADRCVAASHHVPKQEVELRVHAAISQEIRKTFADDVCGGIRDLLRSELEPVLKANCLIAPESMSSSKRKKFTQIASSLLRSKRIAPPENVSGAHAKHDTSPLNAGVHIEQGATSAQLDSAAVSTSPHDVHVEPIAPTGQFEGVAPKQIEAVASSGLRGEYTEEDDDDRKQRSHGLQRLRDMLDELTTERSSRASSENGELESTKLQRGRLSNSVAPRDGEAIGLNEATGAGGAANLNPLSETHVTLKSLSCKMNDDSSLSESRHQQLQQALFSLNNLANTLLIRVEDGFDAVHQAFGVVNVARPQGDNVSLARGFGAAVTEGKESPTTSKGKKRSVVRRAVDSSSSTEGENDSDAPPVTLAKPSETVATHRRAIAGAIAGGMLPNFSLLMPSAANFAEIVYKIVNIEHRRNVRVNFRNGTVTLVKDIEFRGKKLSEAPEGEYRDREAAIICLKDVVELWNMLRVATVIEGHTKGGENDFWRKLAHSRAELVAKTLTNLGIDESKIEYVGLPGREGLNKVGVVVRMILFPTSE
eukprot:TRINITY_DN42751_c0_g1_i1.p1 TRINITY_DN42751_c0_g1~~TRINITY_DN42751_c0_g1_i1.p1  ORF type:complete len:770 (-),score=139.39 TRINITY_DN42751_c0_g1_i1:32-2341(-)